MKWIMLTIGMPSFKQILLNIMINWLEIGAFIAAIGSFIIALIFFIKPSLHGKQSTSKVEQIDIPIIKPTLTKIPNNKIEFVSVKFIHEKDDRDYLIGNGKYYRIKDWDLLRWLIGINKEIYISDKSEKKKYVEKEYLNQYEEGEVLDIKNFAKHIDLKIDDDFLLLLDKILYYINISQRATSKGIHKWLRDKIIYYNLLETNDAIDFLQYNYFITASVNMGEFVYKLTHRGNDAVKNTIVKHLPTQILKVENKSIEITTQMAAEPSDVINTVKVNDGSLIKRIWNNVNSIKKIKVHPYLKEVIMGLIIGIILLLIERFIIR